MTLDLEGFAALFLGINKKVLKFCELFLLASCFGSKVSRSSFGEFSRIQQEVRFGKGKKLGEPELIQGKERIPKCSENFKVVEWLFFWKGEFHTELVGFHSAPMKNPTQLTSMHSCSLPYMYNYIYIHI